MVFAERSHFNDSAYTFENASISDPGYWKESKGDIAIFFDSSSRLVDEDDLAVTQGGYIGRSTTAYDTKFWEQRNVGVYGNIDICKDRKDYPAQSTKGFVKDFFLLISSEKSLVPFLSNTSTFTWHLPLFK